MLKLLNLKMILHRDFQSSCMQIEHISVIRVVILKMKFMQSGYEFLIVLLIQNFKRLDLVSLVL